MNTTDSCIPPVTADRGRPARQRVLARAHGPAVRVLGAVVAVGAVLAAGLAVAGPAAASTAATSATADTWSEPSPATSPPVGGGALAYDPASGQTIYFVEDDVDGTPTAETWDWNGSTWTQLDPATSPSARFTTSMAYDPALDGLVLFGGESESGSDYVFDDDTWLWNGTTWTQLSPATSPSARGAASMAYDQAAGQLILFGGEGGNPTIGANELKTLKDTWVFNGTTWTKSHPATSPPAHQGASMAYDPATGQLVLFGGINNTGLYNDTWTWNGTTWTKRHPATSPGIREEASMAYDQAAGQLILFGGIGDLIYDDTWTWTGSTWTQLTPASSPPGDVAGAMTYDASTGLLVLFGGQDVGPASTWTYGVPPSVAPGQQWTLEVNGGGCSVETFGANDTWTSDEGGSGSYSLSGPDLTETWDQGQATFTATYQASSEEYTGTFGGNLAGYTGQLVDGAVSTFDGQSC